MAVSIYNKRLDAAQLPLFRLQKGQRTRFGWYRDVFNRAETSHFRLPGSTSSKQIFTSSCHWFYQKQPRQVHSGTCRRVEHSWSGDYRVTTYQIPWGFIQRGFHLPSATLIDNLFVEGISTRKYCMGQTGNGWSRTVLGAFAFVSSNMKQYQYNSGEFGRIRI